MRKLLMASMALIAAPAMAFNFGMSDQGTSFGPNNWGNGNNGWNNGPSFGWGNNRSWGNGPQPNWNGSSQSMHWGSQQVPMAPVPQAAAPVQQPPAAAPRDNRSMNIDRDQTMKFDRSTFSWGNGWSPRTGSGWGPTWGNGPSMNIMPGWNNNNYPPRYYYPQAPQQQAPVPVAK
jgi:hypothetical protein